MTLELINTTHRLVVERRERARGLGNDLVTQIVFGMRCSCGNCAEDPAPAPLPECAADSPAALLELAATQLSPDVRRRCAQCGKAAPVDGVRIFVWSQQLGGDGLVEHANGVGRIQFLGATAAAAEDVLPGDARAATLVCDQLLRAADFVNGLEGRRTEAVPLWQRAANAAPLSPMPCIALARAALLSAEADEGAALEHLRNAAAHADGYAPACRQLGALLGELALRHRDGELLNRALDWLDQALDLEPGHPATSFALGRIFINSGNLQEGLDHLAVAATHAPLADDADHLRGVALLQLGRADEAHQVFERLAAKHPEDLDALRMRAWTRARSGDSAGALKELDALLAAHPEDEETQNFRDLVAADLED